MDDKSLAYKRGGNAYKNGYWLCHNPYLALEQWDLAARWELGWYDKRAGKIGADNGQKNIRTELCDPLQREATGTGEDRGGD